MIDIPYQLERQLLSPNDQPVYVLEILWADGLHGQEGVNDLYFSTADNILDFPYPSHLYPILDIKKVSAVSAKLDVKNGTSTIGNMTFSILNPDKIFSKIVLEADKAGHGLRRQRAELYKLDRQTGWNARIKLRTLQIDDFSHDTARAKLVCADIKRLTKKTIFEPELTYLAQNISATATSIYLGSQNAIPDLTFLNQPVHGNACFIKIEDEIIKLSAFDTTTNLATVAPNGRGAFSTTAALHNIPSQGLVVSELVVLRGNPVALAIQALSVGTGSSAPYVPSAYDVLPPKWTCSLDYTGANPELDLPAWEALAAFTGYDAAVGLSSGIQFEYLFDKGVEVKKFVEQTVLRNVGGYSKVLGNGAYSCAINPDLSAVDVNTIPDSMTLTLDDVVKINGDLKYNYPKMVNRMRIEYDEQPILSGKFVRSTLFYDAKSEKKWGKQKELTFKAEGMIPVAENINTMHARYIPMLARVSNPPLSLSLTATRKATRYEVGDVLRIQLPIEDISAGGIDLDRPFEIMSISQSSWDGNVKLALEAQPTKADITALTTAFIGDSPPRSNAQAYAVGLLVNDINSRNYGAIGAQNTYHFVGDQTLNTNVGIWGDVTWYVDGVLKINALINGRGHGVLGAQNGYNAGGWLYGNRPNNRGYIAKGGRGGSVGTNHNRGWGTLDTLSPLHPSVPVIAPFLTQFDNSVPKVASKIAGLDNAPFWGGGGGSGAYDAAHGGDGGAGLKIICRGIQMLPNGSIDVRGTVGANGVGAGGGGGGGVVGIFVELAAGGLATTRIIDPSKIYTAGGNPGVASLQGYGAGEAWGFSGYARKGASGALISEVF